MACCRRFDVGLRDACAVCDGNGGEPAGILCELIDLRSILARNTETGRALRGQDGPLRRDEEAPLTGGFGARSPPSPRSAPS